MVESLPDRFIPNKPENIAKSTFDLIQNCVQNFTVTGQGRIQHGSQADGDFVHAVRDSRAVDSVGRGCELDGGAVAWACAIENRARPTALLLSRQNLPYAPKGGLDGIARGAYVLAEPTEVGLKKKAQAVIIATGSEVQLALHAQQQLAAEHGIAVRVVSMPSTSVFDRQDRAPPSPSRTRSARWPRW